MIGVAQLVVERAQRLLAAVEVRDRHALERRRERRRRGLEPVADEQQRVGPGVAEVGGDQPQGVGGLVGRGPFGRRPRVVREPAQLGRGLEPVLAQQADRQRRGAPRGACHRRRRRGEAAVSSRIARHVERRMPQSWRPVVRTAIDRTGSGSVTPAPRDRPARSSTPASTPRPVRRPTTVPAARRRQPGSGSQDVEVVGATPRAPPAAAVASGGCAGRRARRRARPRPAP